MEPTDSDRIRHMIEAGESALRFAHGRNRQDLDSDEMLTFALTRALEIVGEAASKISPEARARMPSVPWSVVTGMRHRLIHAYFDVDCDILWSTVTTALPPLLEHLRNASAAVDS